MDSFKMDKIKSEPTSTATESPIIICWYCGQQRHSLGMVCDLDGVEMFCSDCLKTAQKPEPNQPHLIDETRPLPLN
jgi:formylmethanofuran dehydrogenase subunit E